MIQLRKLKAGNRIRYFVPVALMLLVAACGPTDTENENSALPTLAEQSQSVAQVPTDGLLPTLVPYPTIAPSATPTATEPVEPEIVQAEVTAEASVGDPNDPFSGGGIEFPADEGPPASEDGADTDTENLDLPPGVNPEDVVTGSGGTLDSEGEQGPPGFDPQAGGDSDELFSGGGISFDGPPGVDLSGTTDNASFDGAGDLPFDTNAASTGDPFSSAGSFPGASGTSSHIIGGEQPVSVFECPETTCDVVGTLEAGDSVVVVEESGEWTGIQFQGSTAYVFGNFVVEQQREQASFSDGPDFSSDFSDGEFNPDTGLPFDVGAGSSDDPFGTGPGAFSGGGTSQGARYVEGSGFSTGSGFGSSNLNPLFNAPSTTSGDFGGDSPPFDTGSGTNNPGGTPGVDCPPFLDTC